MSKFSYSTEDERKDEEDGMISLFLDLQRTHRLQKLLHSVHIYVPHELDMLCSSFDSRVCIVLSHMG